MAKIRHSRLQGRKASSFSTLTFTMLVMFSFVVLILVALGILSVPSSSGGDSTHKPNDLTSIVRKNADRLKFRFQLMKTFCIIWLFEFGCLTLVIDNFGFVINRSEGDEGKGERWVEVISWEPRAFIYHNFLVSLFLKNCWISIEFCFVYCF